ncbi:hypothetical protein G7Z17_g2036 [Cylindrodendrum hubeiense]|uniref:SCP domain-containing protein n=1 Tax=Cylindrodendrum hubeiense TaxID=595255 RepID=A0A9P5LEU4_9HYPO|nr:hypothetical protein G7Z17_g2036 [Cylindrodendrum hubeiense]
MHFSAFVLAVLATNASALKGNCRPKTWQTKVTTEQPTIATPIFSEIATTPVYTPVYTPVEEVPEVTPTTLITRKASSSKATSTKTAAAAVTTSTAAAAVVTTTTAAAVSTTAAAAVATTAASDSATSGLTADQQSALDAHNSARSDVGNADLVWDAALAADAQEWATHLVSLGSLEHSSVEDQGENLYMQYTTDSPYTNAVAAFVAEKSSYNGEVITSTNYLTFGHYTQVVWKDTTKVGMAIASGTSGEVYVVARYSLPGNYMGETPY